MSRLQRTLAGPVVFEGVGLHGGGTSTLRVLPAGEDHGRVFRVRERRIPCSLESVVATDRCTSLGDGEVRVATVEHVLAAAAALGLDNLILETQEEEVPVMDGSALPFVEGFLRVGVVEQTAPVEPLSLTRPVFVAHAESLVLALPAQEAAFEAAIHFAHPLVGSQQWCFRPAEDRFETSLAPARTFGFWDEVQALLERGLARGGDFSNALVIGGPGGFSSPPRFADEPVRHKVLDLLGDLALLGRPIQARVLAVRAGHRLHLELARKILKEGAHAGLV